MGLFYHERETIDDLQKRAAGLVAEGFRGVKMKVGGMAWKEDLERVAAVREAIGVETLLMVDANRAYNSAAAIEMGRRMILHNVFWFEEPVPPEDIEGYRAVRAALPMLIAGGECEYTRYGFHRLLQARAVDVVQPEICATGGLSECRKIADMAYTAGVFYVPHMHGSALALAANLQLVASMAPVSSEFGPKPPTVELDTLKNPLREELLVEPLIPLDGIFTIPMNPGLGVEVNRNVVARLEGNTP
jgi:D-galactarolactone cycloisomerase